MVLLAPASMPKAKQGDGTRQLNETAGAQSKIGSYVRNMDDVGSRCRARAMLASLLCFFSPRARFHVVAAGGARRVNQTESTLCNARCAPLQTVPSTRARLTCNAVVRDALRRKQAVEQAAGEADAEPGKLAADMGRHRILHHRP